MNKIPFCTASTYVAFVATTASQPEDRADVQRTFQWLWERARARCRDAAGFAEIWQLADIGRRPNSDLKMLCCLNLLRKSDLLASRNCKPPTGGPYQRGCGR